MMAFTMRFVSAAALVAGLAVAPAAQARDWHGHYDYYHHGYNYYHHGYDYYHHGGNNSAAIIGGLIGLGLGAAIASGGYAPPPPAYYGPPPGYYAPPPPAVYYGY
jgi:hypothetical protein